MSKEKVEENLRQYLITTLGDNINTLGNYLQTLLEKAYLEGYNQKTSEQDNWIVVKYIRISDNAIFKRTNDDKFIWSSVSGDNDSNSPHHTSWSESLFLENPKKFRPYTISLKDQQYNIKVNE